MSEVRYEAPMVVLAEYTLPQTGHVVFRDHDWSNYPKPWMRDAWPGRECLPVHPPTTDPEDC